MKKHITIEQLNELNDEQKDKMREWWEKDADKHFYYGMTLEQKQVPALLSIGQMIEFLLEQENKYSKDSIYMEWQIRKDPTICIGWDEEQSELCDALWEAVKEAL